MNSRHEGGAPSERLQAVTAKRTLARLEVVSATLGALVLALGVSVLAAWQWNIEPLQTLVPSGAPMRPLVALGVVLLALSLLLQYRTDAPQQKHWQWLIARPAAAAVMVVGLLALSQHVLGWDLGIDRWLFEEKLRRFPFANPHRLPPGAALCLALVGAALLALDAQTARGRRPAQALLLGALLVSYLVIIGYLFHGPWLFSTVVKSGMAVHAAVAFTLLSIGALCARPEDGVLELLCSECPGGVIARRLLPVVLIAPAALGWLHLVIEERGLFDTALNTALLVAITTVLFAVLGWATARQLNRTDAERKRAQEALREAKERTANILESIGDGFFSLDRQWRVTHVNEKGARLTGKTREEMLGRNLWELFPEAVGSRFQEAYQRVLAEQVTVTLQEFYPPLNKWFEVRAYPSVEGLSVFYADVTDNKRAEQALHEAREQLARHAQNLEAAVAARTQELQQTIRDLETFSYSMSHDLRAPLRAIQGFTEMIGMTFGEALGDEGRGYIRMITSATQRMDRLIHDVLICTKLSRQEVKLHTLDVEAFIRQLMAERPAWQPPQADIRIESPLLPARAAESFLVQCVTHLVENALKFIAPGQTPHVRIRSEAHGERVRLWFEDDGIGIPKESHDQLFKMFSRLHPHANYEGTGIGLYIVRVAAGHMGGRVGVESDADGGSRFWLELPQADTP